VKRLFPKAVLASSAAAVILILTLILNLGIANAQMFEDNKVVSEPAVSLDPVSTQISETTEKNVKWEILKLDPGDSIQRSEKDLDPQDIANLAAKAINEYFDYDASDETFALSHANSMLCDKSLLFASCETSGDFSYNVFIESVTGKVYDAARWANDLNAYPDIEQEVYTEGGTFVPPEDEESFRNQQMADPAYTNAAESFITGKFPDKTISKAKNIYQGSMSGKIGTSTVQTAVDFTDGSGYMITMGSETKTILGLMYYPDGVVNFLKDEYESVPEKLSVYDSLDD